MVNNFQAVFESEALVNNNLFLLLLFYFVFLQYDLRPCFIMKGTKDARAASGL